LDHSRGFPEAKFIRGFHENDKTKYSPFQSQQASAKVWSIYIAEAERYDAALVESWKADMEGLLIFVRIPPARNLSQLDDFLSQVYFLLA
jgi:acyl CoA:acetate/3-ketoacid CoA transferase alpha subunit